APGTRRAEAGSAAPKAAKTKDDDCTAELVKPKALGAAVPQYTEEARSAGIEGRVRLQLTIDATGAVTEARVAQGLGHGLDQAAVAAAQRMKFTPGTRCGRAVAAPFSLSMRFVLGE